MILGKKSFENIVGDGENAVISILSFCIMFPTLYKKKQVM